MKKIQLLIIFLVLITTLINVSGYETTQNTELKCYNKLKIINEPLNITQEPIKNDTIERVMVRIDNMLNTLTFGFHNKYYVWLGIYDKEEIVENNTKPIRMIQNIGGLGLSLNPISQSIILMRAYKHDKERIHQCFTTQ